MRISDVFAMGGGYGYGGGGYGYVDDSCYSRYPYCLRSYDSPDKYDSRRLHRRGLAEILGSSRDGDGLLGLLG